MSFSHPRAPVGLIAVGLIAVALAPALGGCHSRSRQADSAPLAGVGFVLPAGGAVERGAIVTNPPGREEGFLAFVAAGTQKWIEACRGEAGGPSPLFTFQTDGRGHLPLRDPKPAAPRGSGAWSPTPSRSPAPD